MTTGKQHEAHEKKTDDERRWSMGAWLTLAAVILMLVVPTVIGIVQFNSPSDGWTAAPSGGDRGSYTMLFAVESSPEVPLLPDDEVLSVDGLPLQPGEWPPLPPDLQAGQILDYAIERAGTEQDVQVRLFRPGRSSYFVSFWQVLSADPILAVVSVLSLLLACIVFALRPGNPSSRYLLLIFTMFSGTAFLVEASQSLYHYQLPVPLLFLSEMAANGWIAVFMPALALLTLSYPAAKGPARRFPKLTPALFFGIPLILATGVAAFAVLTRHPGAISTVTTVATLFVAVVCLGTAAVALVHNLFTVRDPLARVQMRWFGLGLGLGLVLPLATIFVITFGSFETTTQTQKVVNSIATLLTLLLPTSLAIGILRYRLFDIDVIIRKTTSYAILSGLLALVYFGSVVVLQRLLSPITGESTAAVVLSTLLIAALFLPLRRRVQAAIDRRFFRKKYDAEQVLARFAATARDETDLDALTAELLRVIQETMEPETVSIWLRPVDESPAPADDEWKRPAVGRGRAA